MNLLTYFPEKFTPRDTQIQALTKISQALNNKQKFIILQSATGSGKSFISKCIANIAEEHDKSFVDAMDDYDFNAASSEKGAYIITVSKRLQDQYTELFDDIKICKGKGNFKCFHDKDVSCDVGLCTQDASLKRGCLIEDACPYYLQKKIAMKNKITVLNYDQYFSLELPIAKRDIIICDEASELEAKLVEVGTLNIDTEVLKKNFKISVKTFPTTETILIWLNEIRVSLDSWLNDNTITQKNIKRDSALVGKIQLAQQLVEKIIIVNECWETSDYNLTHEINSTQWVLTPTYISGHAKYIFNNANTVILMSATIIDHKTFAKTLGIKDYEFIDIESNFDPKSAPIYISSKFKLNYKNLKDSLPGLVEFVKSICEHHKSERGIIHTHTQYIANYIKNNYNSNRLLVRSDNISNENILNIHQQCKNSILVSPSLTHGIDLKDDLARFQIVVKTPWLPLGDVRISKLSKIDPQWYISKMFTTLIQACGRGVRTQDDWCVTYIIDGSIINLIQNNTSILPKYFLDRIK